MRLVAVGNLHSRCPLALEDQASDHCATEHSEIRSVHVGKGIRPKHRLASSIAQAEFKERGATIALHHATVMTLESWNPYRSCPFHNRGRYWIGVGRWLNKYQPS